MELMSNKSLKEYFSGKIVETPIADERGRIKRVRSSPELCEEGNIKKGKDKNISNEMEAEVGKMCLKELLAEMSKLIDAKSLASKKGIEVIRIELKEIKEENLALKGEVECLKLEIRKRDDKIEMLENYTKRNNLLFKGLRSEKDAEKDTVMKICKEVLDVDISGMVQDVYCVGTNNSMVKVEYENKKVVNEILRNTRKLRGTGLFIERDYAWRTRMKRRNLLLIKKELLQKNSKLRTQILGDTLFIEGRRYKWCEEEGGLKGCSEEDGKWLKRFTEEK